MDQIKIGRFIAERRKAVGMTQQQLADKLCITDRAVSKWETGRSLPDSAIMLELCRLLDISVNDLLCGEVVSMDNYNEKLESNLLEMVKQKEAADKRLLTLEYVIGILSVIVLLVPVMAAGYLQMADWQRIALIITGFVPCVIGLFFAIKIEQVAGYYRCSKCGHCYVPTFKAVTWSMHMGRTRYMKCPECGKISWQKKVISKE